MNETSLDRLHDIVVPPASPWWPPAPGWYWLIGFAAAIGFVLLLQGVILWQRSRYRREALAELKILERAAAAEADHADALAGVSELLKRTALTAFPRREVASLTGSEWFAFLDRTGGTSFASGSGLALQEAVNDPRSAAGWTHDGIAQTVALARTWIRQHRVGDHTTSDAR